ncbi:MAG: SDR family oxidoreductase, partial [bacterium]|nr:SDR family oxidoreductase [bacterium]
DHIVTEARRVWDKVNALVNNAAIQGPIGPLVENDWDEWTQTIRVNLLAPVALCRLVSPWMAESGGGAIVNLSGGGATGPRPRFSAYATAKAGLVRFSETLAAEAAPQGVRVNCVAPGSLRTDMLRDMMAAGRARTGDAEFDRAIRCDREGGDPPERAAELVAFLVSGQAAGITGRLISAVWDPWPRLAELAGELRDTEIYTLRRIVPSDRGLDWDEPEPSP